MTRKPPNGKKEAKRFRIRDEAGINFVQHMFWHGVVFRRELCYVEVDPDDPFNYKLYSEQEYTDAIMSGNVREDNNFYKTGTLVPLETNKRVLRVLDEDEYQRLTEAGIWADVLSDLEIHNWENFDRAYAELEKRKKQLNEDD